MAVTQQDFGFHSRGFSKWEKGSNRKSGSVFHLDRARIKLKSFLTVETESSPSLSGKACRVLPAIFLRASERGAAMSPPPPVRLDGKTAVVTGGTKGLGYGFPLVATQTRAGVTANPCHLALISNLFFSPRRSEFFFLQFVAFH